MVHQVAHLYRAGNQCDIRTYSGRAAPIRIQDKVGLPKFVDVPEYVDLVVIWGITGRLKQSRTGALKDLNVLDTLPDGIVEPFGQATSRQNTDCLCASFDACIGI